MPDFEKAPPAAKGWGGGKGRNGNGAKPTPKVSTAVTEPRCNVCNHASRKVIDKFLARGVPYTELERIFGISRKSLSNHDKSHLNIDDAAMRRLIREQAEDADLAMEEGIQGVLKRKVFLEAALDNALNAILKGDIMVEPRDAVAIIDKLDAMDSKTTEAQVTQMKIEFNALVTAIKAIVPEAMWDQVTVRARQEADRQSHKLKALDAGDEI